MENGTNSILGDLTAMGFIAGNCNNDEKFLAAKIDANHNSIANRDQINDVQRGQDNIALNNFIHNNELASNNRFNQLTAALAACCCENRVNMAKLECKTEALATEIITENRNTVALLSTKMDSEKIRELELEILLSKVHHPHGK